MNRPEHSDNDDSRGEGGHSRRNFLRLSGAAATAATMSHAPGVMFGEETNSPAKWTLALFSISYAGFWGQSKLDLPQFIRKAKETGYDAVMLAGKRPQLSPLDASDDRIAQLRDELQQAEVTCPVIAGYTDLGTAAAAEVPITEMQIAYVAALSRIGAKLGAKVVRIFTGYDAQGKDPQALWQRSVVAIREMCDRAAEHGLDIAIQNHHDLGVETTALLELLGDIDRKNCKLGFDAWSPALRGEDLYEAAKLAAPHTAITTSADYIRLPRFRYRPELVNYEKVSPDMVRAVPFGSGFIDYSRFFDGLRDGGFQGVATYEMCSPLRGGGSLENLDHCACQYVKWMHEYMQQ